MPALMEKRALGNHNVPIRCRLSEPRTAEVQKVTAASRAPDEIIARKKCRDPDDAARGGAAPPAPPLLPWAMGGGGDGGGTVTMTRGAAIVAND